MECPRSTLDPTPFPILLEPALPTESRNIILGAAQALEMSDEPATITLPDRRFIYVNPAFEQLYGFSPVNMIGNVDLPLHPPEFPGTLIEAIYTGTATGGWTGRLMNQNIRKETFEIVLKTRPLRTSSGELAGCLGMSHPSSWERFPISDIRLPYEPPPALPAASSQTSPLLESLSRRERTVLKCYGLGMNTKEIASSLQISSTSVFTYRTRLSRKLGIKSAADFYLAAAQAAGELT